MNLLKDKKAERVLIQPPLEEEEGATPAPAPIKPAPSGPGSKPEPEPALPIPTPRSQEILAEESMAQQTVRKRGEMTPNETVPYAFTDSDRKAASLSHWEKYNWDEAPMEEALERLAVLRAEVEKGGLALQKRISENRVERVKCFACENIIEISQGRWAGMRTRNNFETGLPESAYACSARCDLIMKRTFTHPTNRVVKEE